MGRTLSQTGVAPHPVAGLCSAGAGVGATPANRMLTGRWQVPLQTMPDASALSPPASRAGRGIVLALVLLVALALRIREAAGTHLWFDELYLVMVARHSWLGVVQLVAHDIHPPLYFLLIKGWIALGGTGEAWLRAPSIAFGLGSLVATFELGRRLRSGRTGLVAAALLALDSAHVRYSQDVESYALMWVLALMVALSAVAWVQERRGRDALMLMAAAVIGAYTHYLMLAVFLVTVLWGVAVLHDDRRALVRWLGFAALVLALFVPQVPTVIRQLAQEDWGGHYHWPSVDGLVGLGRVASGGATYLLPVFALLALLALVNAERRWTTALLVMLCCLLPLTTRAWAFVLNRDLLVLVPFWVLLAAAGLEQITWRRAGIVATGLLLLLAARASWMHHRFDEPRELARAASVITRDAPQDAILLHSETHSLLYFAFYQPSARNRLLFPAGQHVHFSDGGLVVDDSLLISPEAFLAERARGVPWWGVHCDRAFVRHGVVERAGQPPEELMDSLATGRHWSFPPVQVWEGAPRAIPR